MQSALKELTSNKISYTRFVSYKDKETEEIKNDYVITNSKKVFIFEYLNLYILKKLY